MICEKKQRPWATARRGMALAFTPTCADAAGMNATLGEAVRAEARRGLPLPLPPPAAAAGSAVTSD